MASFSEVTREPSSLSVVKGRPWEPEQWGLSCLHHCFPCDLWSLSGNLSETQFLCLYNGNTVNTSTLLIGNKYSTCVIGRNSSWCVGVLHKYSCYCFYPCDHSNSFTDFLSVYDHGLLASVPTTATCVRIQNLSRHTVFPHGEGKRCCLAVVCKLIQPEGLAEGPPQPCPIPGLGDGGLCLGLATRRLKERLWRLTPGGNHCLGDCASKDLGSWLREGRHTPECPSWQGDLDRQRKQKGGAPCPPLPAGPPHSPLLTLQSRG